MKVCIINGSHRKNGNCQRFALKAKEILEKKHIVTVYNLAELDIIPCNGCLICEDGEECPLIDNYAESICPTLKESDLIIFASPTYFNMPSALLVNLLDRTNNLCEFCAENQKKVLVYLVGQTDVETITDAYNCLKTYFDIMNMEEVTEEPIIRIARMPEAVDEDTIDILKKI